MPCTSPFRPISSTVGSKIPGAILPLVGIAITSTSFRSLGTDLVGLGEGAGVKSISSLLLRFLVSLVSIPVHTTEAFDPLEPCPRPQVWKWMRLVILPVFILMAYTPIYSSANPRFGQLRAGLFGGFAEVFDYLFSFWFSRHVLFVLGSVLAIALLNRTAPDVMGSFEAGTKDQLIRVRRKRSPLALDTGMNNLERERRIGILLFV